MVMMVAVQPHSHTHIYGNTVHTYTYLRPTHINTHSCSLTKLISKRNLGTEIDLSWMKVLSACVCLVSWVCVYELAWTGVVWALVRVCVITNKQHFSMAVSGYYGLSKAPLNLLHSDPDMAGSDIHRLADPGRLRPWEKQIDTISHFFPALICFYFNSDNRIFQTEIINSSFLRGYLKHLTWITSVNQKNRSGVCFWQVPAGQKKQYILMRPSPEMKD